MRFGDGVGELAVADHARDLFQHGDDVLLGLAAGQGRLAGFQGDHLGTEVNLDVEGLVVTLEPPLARRLRRNGALRAGRIRLDSFRRFIIPANLRNDPLDPGLIAEAFDSIAVGNKGIPGVATCGDDVLSVGPDGERKESLAQEQPNALDRIAFR